MNFKYKFLTVLDKCEKLFKPKKHLSSDNITDEFDFIPGKTENDDAFTLSLDNMTVDDVGVSITANRKKKSKSGLIRRVILIVSCIVFVVCAVYLVYDIVDQKRGGDYYDSIADEWGNILDDDIPDGAVLRLKNFMPSSRILCLKDRLSVGGTRIDTNNPKTNEMKAKLASLSLKFPDLVGWIYVENTAINYPIVQGPDNDYYLDHAPDKTNLINGSIFEDYTNSKNLLNNFNTVLYGHNLAGGGMFHDVTKFKDEAFFNNALIYIYTPDGAYVYKPFAIYETHYDYQYFRTNFASANDFVAFANEMKGNSMFVQKIDFKGSDHILTMSTCTNGAYWGRYCLQSRLVQIIN